MAVLVECRGKREDTELQLALQRLCDGASSWGKMSGLSIEFFDKKANLPGLQIADLVSTPIGRHVFRPESRNRAFEMIRRKFRQAPEGAGPRWDLRVFP